MKNTLKYDFDENLFKLIDSEEWEEVAKTIGKAESEINRLLVGAKTLYFGGGVNVHCVDHFSVSFDPEHDDCVLLNVNDENEGNTEMREAALIAIDKGQRLELERIKGIKDFIVSIKVKNIPSSEPEADEE